MVDTSSTRAYASWWQARSDTWSRLEEASGQLAATFVAGQADEEMVETASGLLDALAPVERYWAYPGPEAFRLVRDLFAAASSSASVSPWSAPASDHPMPAREDWVTSARVIRATRSANRP